jgi:hypothetical protein
MGYYPVEKSNTKSKRKIRRNILADIDEEYNRSITVLTLPNINFILEKELLARGHSVICVEIDKNVYEKQKEICRQQNLDIKLYHMDVMEYIEKEDISNIDVAFFDMMNPMKDSIFTMLKNCTIPHLYLTLCKAHEHRPHNIRMLSYNGDSRVNYFKAQAKSRGYKVQDDITHYSRMILYELKEYAK